MWGYAGVCHCNSHKRSNFWNNRRSCALLGGLKTFNLTLSETDAHLRHAGTSSSTCGHGYEIWIVEIIRLNHLLCYCNSVCLCSLPLFICLPLVQMRCCRASEKSSLHTSLSTWRERRWRNMVWAYHTSKASSTSECNLPQMIFLHHLYLVVGLLDSPCNQKYSDFWTSTLFSVPTSHGVTFKTPIL